MFNATLRGDYAFTINGQVFPPGKPIITRDGVAITHFDGNGVLSQNDFVMQYPDMMGMSSPVPNDDPPDPITGFNVGETGTYHVNEDCTGWMEIDFSPSDASGQFAMAKGDPSMALADDLERRRIASPSKIESWLGCDVRMAPAVDDDARNVAPGIESRITEHLLQLFSYLKFEISVSGAE